MTNTVLTVCYRDAANYKTAYELRLSGQFSSEQWDRLKKALDEETGFVPDQVGLDNPAKAFVGYDSFPNEELDHGWCELPEAEGDYEDLYPCCAIKASTPARMSVEEFVAACEATTWDPLAEYERLKASA